MTTNANKLFDLHRTKNNEWNTFQELTQKNLDNVESAIQSSQQKCRQFESAIENIKELSQTARSKSYLKICSLAYVEGFVKHTGEYNVELGPDYQVTLTRDQTIEYLDEQLSGERCVLNTFKAEREQLQRRLGYDFAEVDDIADVSDMPESILSDKGMAFKRGHFFEIVEEDDTPCRRAKRISRVRTHIEKKVEEMKLDAIKDVNDRAEAFLNLIEK